MPCNRGASHGSLLTAPVDVGVGARFRHLDDVRQLRFVTEKAPQYLAGAVARDAVDKADFLGQLVAGESLAEPGEDFRGCCGFGDASGLEDDVGPDKLFEAVPFDRSCYGSVSYLWVLEQLAFDLGR